MKKSDNLRSKILWSVIVCAGALVLGRSLAQIWTMPSTELLQCSILLLLTAFVGSFPVFAAASAFYAFELSQGMYIRFDQSAIPLEPLVYGLGILASIHYLINATAISVLVSFRTGKTLLVIFRHNQFFFWASINFFAGAS